MHWLNRISGIVKEWNSDRPLDVLHYSEEFIEKQKISSVVKEAVKKGIVL